MNKNNLSLNTMKRVVAQLLVSVVLSTALFAGGDKYSPRLVGMGRTFSAVSRGLDAVGVNPANLALNDRDATVTINVAPLGISLGSDFLNLKIYITRQPLNRLRFSLITLLRSAWLKN